MNKVVILQCKQFVRAYFNLDFKLSKNTCEIVELNTNNTIKTILYNHTTIILRRSFYSI